MNFCSPNLNSFGSGMMPPHHPHFWVDPTGRSLCVCLSLVRGDPLQMGEQCGQTWEEKSVKNNHHHALIDCFQLWNLLLGGLSKRVWPFIMIFSNAKCFTLSGVFAPIEFHQHPSISMAKFHANWRYGLLLDRSYVGRMIISHWKMYFGYLFLRHTITRVKSQLEAIHEWKDCVVWAV